MNYLVSVLTGYILGSIPTAYLLVKFRHGTDLRNEGSKNVGMLNSYKVSKSKIIAAVVLLIDIVKGVLAVYLVKLLYGEVFIYPMIALISAVAGHCFSVWIKFKGGRGLAAAAGGALVLAPAVLIIWIFLWIVSYVFRKNVHFSNISATILTGAVSAVNADILNKYSFPPAEDPLIFGAGVCIMLTIIMIRHYEPLMAWINLQKKSKRQET